MQAIEVNGNAWPSAQASSGGVYSSQSPPLKDTGYIVIHTTGPLSGEEQDQLKRNEVEILEYLGNDVYLCGYKPDSFTNVTANHFVTAADVFHPDCVVEQSLKRGNPDQKVHVEISLHANVEDAEFDAVSAKIAEIVGVSEDEVEIVDGGITKITIPKSKLARLAEIDEVYTVNQFHEAQLFNNIACEIMQVRGQAGANSAVYKGKGQKIFVADTGFDSGDKVKHHAAFGTRVKGLFPLGRETACDDPHGHGTHVCGSVLGMGTHRTDGVIEAAASEADLYMQSLFDSFDSYQTEAGDTAYRPSLAGTRRPYAQLFQPAIDAGAYIHTNSWGATGNYTAVVSGTIDDFTWRNPRMVILFSAGNSGREGAETMSIQGSARNCITVGASQSTRSMVSGQAASKNSVAVFSSRGPTGPGGQIKPDVVAPGTDILSTRSSAIDAKYVPASFDKKDDTWQFKSGTSMATPLVAGCCAVLRQALDQNNITKSPTSALVKALLVNGADAIAASPNSDSGFGRVNVANSLRHIGPQQNPPLAGLGERFGANALRLSRTAGDNRQQFSFNIQVPTAGRTFAVTLVWTDPSGMLLQHELELSVSLGSNRLSWSGVSGNTKNNVQQITWTNASVGTYQVTIQAIRLSPQPPQAPAPPAPPAGQPTPVENKEAFQPFAYAWRIY